MSATALELCIIEIDRYAGKGEKEGRGNKCTHWSTLRLRISQRDGVANMQQEKPFKKRATEILSLKI
jgi:hypothetical protein